MIPENLEHVINILLVEDSPSDTFLIETLLSQDSSFQHTITTVQRLQDGLTLLRKRAYDIALTDLQLPDSNGLATFEALNKAAPNLPIIVLTIQGDMATARHAIQAGAQDFLPKSELSSLLIVRTILHAIERQIVETEREKLIQQLQNALTEVKTLSGLLPICYQCKSIRDDSGYWNDIDAYISQHTNASLSHGLCPHCAIKVFEEGGMDVPDRIRTLAKEQDDRKRD